MPKLRVRFKVNPGRHGAPMSKLGKIAEQAEKFLRVLAEDVGLEVKPGQWLASDFQNGSVEFLSELPTAVDGAQSEIFSRKLEYLADFDPDGEGLNGAVSDRVALEYSKIGSILDPDEIIGMGVLPPHTQKPKWRQISYFKLNSMRESLEAPIISHGSIQGKLYSWFKETKRPYVQLFELSSNSRVKVYYPDTLYSQIAKSVQNRDTTVIASGSIQFDRASRQPIEMDADNIEHFSMMTPEQFDSFCGAAPSFDSKELEAD